MNFFMLKMTQFKTVSFYTDIKSTKKLVSFKVFMTVKQQNICPVPTDYIFLVSGVR